MGTNAAATLDADDHYDCPRFNGSDPNRNWYSDWQTLSEKDPGGSASGVSLFLSLE